MVPSDSPQRDEIGHDGAIFGFYRAQPVQILQQSHCKRGRGVTRNQVQSRGVMGIMPFIMPEVINEHVKGAGQNWLYSFVTAPSFFVIRRYVEA